MKRYGTAYGGWNLPEAIALDKDSIVYSGGVGEDISFDILIHDKFKSKLFLIDPTKRSFTHFEEIQEYFKTKHPVFSGNIQKDYLQTIANCHPNFQKFVYVHKGLWSEQGVRNLYHPTNAKYVSHTLINHMYSDTYDIVEVDSIQNIMRLFGHSKIDLLKLDIEGSEIVVLTQMLKDAIFPNYILVEFDLKLKGHDLTKETERIIQTLQTNGYTMMDNSNWNCLFVHTT